MARSGRWLSRGKSQGAIAGPPSPDAAASVAIFAELITAGDQGLKARDWTAVAASATNALAIDADPSHPSSGLMTSRQRAVFYLQLGHSLWEQGDPTAAERTFRNAIAADPTYDYSPFLLGRMLHRNSRTADAPAIYFEGLQATQSPLLRQALLELDYSSDEIDASLAEGRLPAERSIPDDPDFPPCPVDGIREKVAASFWWHSINLGDGIVTPGHKTRYEIAREAEAIFAPVSLRGRSVVDIGAWNGGYTVEAKRRGAARLLAIDDYTWARPELLGKQTFELVMSRLGIEAETKQIDIQKASADQIGRWQVVLFLGVFYHLFNPISAVQVLGEITEEVLILETHLDLEDLPQPAMLFYPDRELGGDPTNWWGPNRAAMEAMLRAVGFQKVLYTQNPLAASNRGIFHAFKSEAIYREHTAAALARPDRGRGMTQQPVEPQSQG